MSVPVDIGAAGKTAVLACGAALIVTMEFLPVGLLPALAAEFGITPDRAGLLIAGFALSAGTVGPLLTLLVGRWSAATALTFCGAVFAATNIVTALWPDFGVMMVMRLVQGAFLTPFIAVASAAAASMAVGGQEGKAIGHINLGTLAGVVFGVPAAVALTDLLSWQAVFLGLGVTTAMVAAAIPGTLGSVRGISEELATLIGRQTAILRRKSLLLHLAMSGLLFTAMFAAYSYLGVFLEQIVGLSARGISLALFGFGVAGLAGNWIIAQFVDRYAIAPTLAITLLLMLATGALALAGGHVPTALALLVPWGAAHAAAFLACQVRVMFAAPDAPAFAASLNIAVCNLGIAAGAVVGGVVISHTDLHAIGIGVTVPGLLVLVVGVLLFQNNAMAHTHFVRTVK